MSATRRSPPRVNSRPTPWRRSPNRRHRISMYRIILFLVLIALAAAGAAWVADQPGDVVLSWSGWRAHHLVAGVRAVARHCHCRGDSGLDDIACILAGAGTYPAQPARTASRARPARHHPRVARDRPRRFHRRPPACRCRAPPCRGRSAGAAAARAISPARRRPRRGAAGVSRHGRARGYKVVGPARPVHRSPARRRSGRRGRASRRKR